MKKGRIVKYRSWLLYSLLPNLDGAHMYSRPTARPHADVDPLFFWCVMNMGNQAGKFKG